MATLVFRLGTFSVALRVTGVWLAAAYLLLATASLLLATASLLLATPVHAKMPGQTHCYREVCHRVKTLAETKALVGRLLTVTASHYDSPAVDRFNTGIYTSSGTKFDAGDPTAVSSSNFPDGTELLVWNPLNGRAAHLRVTDFGPFMGNRTLDLTRAAAETLDFAVEGIAKLEITVVAAPPVDEPHYLMNRVYMKVGGFLGVYRKDELASLGVLLSSQAGRRRQHARALRVASQDTAQARANGGADAPAPNVGSVVPVRFSPRGSNAGLTSSVSSELGSKKAESDQGGIESATVLKTPSVQRDEFASMREFQVGGMESLITKAPVKGGGVLGTRVLAPRIGTREGVSSPVTKVSGRPTSIFGIPNLPAALNFPMENGHVGIVYMMVALMVTSLAFFAAYFSVTGTQVGAGSIDPNPRRRTGAGIHDLAEVEIVVTPSQRAGGHSNDSARRGQDIEAGPAGTGTCDADAANDRVPFRANDNATKDATVIKRGSTIVGNLLTEGGVIVEGTITGDCSCDTLSIASGGVVSGSVAAKMAVIEGRVEGSVDVVNLHAKDRAHVKGNVRYCNLSLDHGAVLEAQCKRVESL